jgi:hypothetical protein
MTLSNHYLVANVGFGSAPGQQGRCERRHQLAGHELHRLAAGGRLHRLHGRRPRRARRGDARGGAEPRHGFYDSHTGEHAIPAAVHLLAGAAVRGGGGVQGARRAVQGHVHDVVRAGELRQLGARGQRLLLAARHALHRQLGSLPAHCAVVRYKYKKIVD